MNHISGHVFNYQFSKIHIYDLQQQLLISEMNSDITGNFIITLKSEIFKPVYILIKSIDGINITTGLEEKITLYGLFKLETNGGILTIDIYTSMIVSRFLYNSFSSLWNAIIS